MIMKNYTSKQLFAVLLCVLMCAAGCRKKTTTKVVKVSETYTPEYVTLPSSDDTMSPLSFLQDDIDAFVLAEEDTVRENMHAQSAGSTELAWQEPQQEEKLMQDSLKLYFPYDGKLPLAHQKVSLDEVGKKAQEWNKKGMTVVCKGHSCLWHGTDAYNAALSVDRARQVALSLETKYNIPASRIKVFGVGNEEPVTLENTMEAQGPNRRVEVYAIAA